MSFVTTDPAASCLQNGRCRLSASIQNAAGDPADPIELRFILMDQGATTIASDLYPTPAGRIVRTGVGEFYVDVGPRYAKLTGVHGIGLTTLTVNSGLPSATVYWPSTGDLVLDRGIVGKEERVAYSAVSIVAGAGTFTLTSPLTISHAALTYVDGPNSETNTPGDFLVNWVIQLSSGGERTDLIQPFRVITTRIASLIPALRQMIDKSHKLIDTANDCFLGYTDAQLVSYLDGGVQTINAYQPSVTFTLEDFPFAYRQILIDAALITGVMSQQLFAIDSDIPNYNDQGTSFVISHQPQLAAFLNQVTQRLDKLIPMMKLQLITSGSVHVQMGPGFRMQQLLDAAPSGALFRNMYFRG